MAEGGTHNIDREAHRALQLNKTLFPQKRLKKDESVTALPVQGTEGQNWRAPPRPSGLESETRLLPGTAGNDGRAGTHTDSFPSTPLLCSISMFSGGV